MIKSIDKYLLTQWQAERVISYRLHSRFNHAINWVNADNEMMTFLTRDLPNAPNTLLINVDDFGDWKLTENTIFYKNEQGYWVDQNLLKMNEPLLIWTMTIPCYHSVNSKFVHKMNDFLNENTEELVGIEATIYEKLDDNYANLVEACKYKKIDEILYYAKESIGLGLGLTPSGDDRLVGFLLGCYMQFSSDDQLIEVLKNSIKISTERTNDISYAMLNTAKDGRFNEWLIDLGEIICDENLDKLESAMWKVFDIGSRSGGDMLKGLVLSLEINHSS